MYIIYTSQLPSVLLTKYKHFSLFYLKMEVHACRIVQQQQYNALTIEGTGEDNGQKLKDYLSRRAAPFYCIALHALEFLQYFI